MPQSPDSDTVTEGLRVRATAQYLAAESDPEHDRYVFAYRIVINNEGSRRAKLLTRHWVILDADNHREDVRGPGVVGQHPDLAAGESFEYMSGCPLATPWGTMEGTYVFERENGERVKVRVGRFFLVSPSVKKEQRAPS
ncbi:MAG: Co2+/Mg2+ efflux protein ApaG [Planctomycetota bacterium]